MIEIDLQTLHIESPSQDFWDTETYYVEDWEHRCGCGLKHAWVKVGAVMSGALLVQDEYFCEEHGENHDTAYWVCLRCREKLEPATVRSQSETPGPSGCRNMTERLAPT